MLIVEAVRASLFLLMENVIQVVLLNTFRKLGFAKSFNVLKDFSSMKASKLVTSVLLSSQWKNVKMHVKKDLNLLELCVKRYAKKKTPYMSMVNVSVKKDTGKKKDHVHLYVNKIRTGWMENASVKMGFISLMKDVMSARKMKTIFKTNESVKENAKTMKITSMNNVSVKKDLTSSMVNVESVNLINSMTKIIRNVSQGAMKTKLLRVSSVSVKMVLILLMDFAKNVKMMKFMI